MEQVSKSPIWRIASTNRQDKDYKYRTLSAALRQHETMIQGPIRLDGSTCNSSAAARRRVKSVGGGRATAQVVVTLVTGALHENHMSSRKSI